jgi:uncharacterized membrane protein (DUF106 family)
MKMDKKGSFKPILIIMFISFLIVYLWDKYEPLNKIGHNILDPSFGRLLNWDITLGMLIIILILSLFITILQKYTTDQKELKKLKEEQKKTERRNGKI